MHYKVKQKNSVGSQKAVHAKRFGRVFFLIAIIVATQTGFFEIFETKKAAAAADQWRQISLGGNGPTWTDIHCANLGSKIACINRAASSPTGALKIIDLSNPLSPTVTTANLPTPVNAAFGRPLGIGGDSNTLIVSGGSQTASSRNTNTGGWVAHTSPSSISWSLDYDNASAEYQYFGNISQFGSPSTWTSGRYYRPSSGVDNVYIQNYNLSPLAQGAVLSYAYSDANTVGGEAQGLAVTNAIYVIGFIANQGATGSYMHFMASNGSIAQLYTPATAYAQSWTQIATMRPAFAYNSAGFFLARSDTSNYTAVVRATSSGISHNAGSPLSGDLRSGADWDPTGSLRGAWGWLSSGQAYRATTTATFSANSTYDISSGILNGATVRQVVGGYTGSIDVDGDGTTTENVIAVLSDGNLAYWGDSLNTTPNSPTINNYNDGGYTNDSTPTLNFDLSDPDSSDTVKYQLQIDDTADFSSTIVDTTEVSGSTTPRSGVTYTPSSLSDGNYYWRVRAIDGSSAQSAYATANSGAIAFRVDTAAPTSTSVSINAGDAYTSSTSATLTLASTDGASGNYQMMLSEDSGFSGAAYQSYATSTPFTLSGGDGTKTVYAKFKDNAGNVSTPVSDTIVYDITAPTSPTISINSGNATTNSQSTTLTLSVADPTSGIADMILSENSDFSGASWEAYAASKSFSLSGGDGSKTVYVKFRDNAGNESASTSDSITLDTTGPTSPTISINSGDAFTASMSVTLGLSASDITSGMSEMIISENSDFSGAVYEPYGTSSAFALSTGNGLKTVYVKFKDAAGNESSAANDTITFDDEAPTGSVSINAAAANTSSVSVTLTIAASDVTGSVAEMEISESATFVGASYEAYATSKAFTLSSSVGTKTVYIRFKDVAGNVSSTFNDTIILDTAGPIPTSFNINSDADYTVSQSTTLTIGAFDLTTSVQDMMISESPLFTSASWESYATSKAFLLSAGDGSKTVYIKFRDAAGNSSLPTFDTITLDTTNPDGSISIDDAAGYTQTTSVVLTLDATDNIGSIAEMMLSEDPDFTGASWEAYSTTKAFTLSSGDGTKTVYAQFKDDAGNSSSATSDSITFDETAPSSLTIRANSDDEATATQEIILTLSASDATSGVEEMMVSESVSFVGASWEPYATTKAFTLSAENGVKTLYFKTKDSAGNSAGAVSDTITLDTVAPTGSIIINSGAGYTAATNVTLTLSASDLTTAVDDMMISQSAAFVGASWEPFAVSHSATLSEGDGTKTVYIKFRDTMGNVSSGYSDSIYFDTTAPSGTVRINGNASTTESRSVTLTIAATDAGSGVATMQVSENPTFVGAVEESYSTSKSYTLSAGEGIKIVYVKFIDALGNDSGSFPDSIQYAVPKNTSTPEAPADDTPTTPSTPTPTSPTPPASDSDETPTTSPEDTDATTHTPGDAYTVVIHVVDENGKPLPGATVILDNKKTAVTDESGDAVFTDIEAGEKTTQVKIGEVTTHGTVSVAGDKDSLDAVIKVSTVAGQAGFPWKAVAASATLVILIGVAAFAIFRGARRKKIG